MASISADVVAAANAKSRRLRELIRAPKILVMPGAHDVLSAMLFESLGFPAIQGSSGGIAAVYGLRDDELLGRGRTAEIYREMAAAGAGPGDAEAGRQFVAAGGAGMTLEDGASHEPGTPMNLVPMEAMLAKIRAIMEAKRALGSEFFLNARVDALGAVKDVRDGIDEAI